MSKLESKECPQPETLSNFLLGKLDPESSQQCESHLAHCDPCVETISGLNLNDTFQSMVANAGVGRFDAELDGDESVVSNLIHRLSDVGARTSGCKSSADQRAADVIALLAQPESPDSIGQIDHYRIENVLGCGSTGVVFGAVDENLNRPVAIKVLRPSLGDAARQRFIAEARATANLNHANVVTIFHVGDNGSVAYIVMQWLPGETLEQRLERSAILDSAAAKNYGIQIANGLAYAHDKGLIHRDIKPANLWITEDDCVKILDFGLVRIMDESPQLTCTGMIAGTPCFMSPEQSRGDELDARSDLFSLGCVLYRCLTGKLPFVSSNALATLQAIQRVSPESPRELVPSVDPELSDLVMTLLEKSPHRRPESSRDVSFALESPRRQWAFDGFCSPARKNIEGQKGKTVPALRTGSSFWIPTIATLAIALAGYGAFAFWPQIIRIATNQGEIVIESDDPDVQIEVLSGGEQIKIVDLKTKQNIQIESGTYQIRALGAQNTVSIDKETLTLSRGETEIVTVRKSQLSDNAEASHGKNQNVVSARIPLRHCKSEDIVETIRELYNSHFEARAGEASIEALNSPNGLLVLGNEGAIEAVREIVHEMDSVQEEIKAMEASNENVEWTREAGADMVARGFDEMASKPKMGTRRSPKYVNIDPMHRVGPGDILGVFVEGVTGQIEDMNGDRDFLGIPVRVRSDGTISLPLVDPIKVSGSNALDIENAIRETYSKGDIFKADHSFHVSAVVDSVYEGNRAAKLREPVYDGMTFEQCLNAIKYERDAEKLRKPCIGIMELKEADSPPNIKKTLLDAILRIQKIDARSNAARRFGRWLTDSQLQELTLEISTGEDIEKWHLVRFSLINEWEKLRQIEDELISNIVRKMESDSIRDEIPAMILSQILKDHAVSDENKHRMFESLIKYAATAKLQAVYYFSTMNSVDSSWPGLGSAMSKQMSQCRDEEISSWISRFSVLGIKNKKEAIEVMATRIFESQSPHGPVYLSSLPEDLLKPIEPIFKKFLAEESESAISFEHYLKKRFGNGVGNEQD